MNQLLIFLIIFTFHYVCALKPIQFINGGYRGITIAIHSHVPENDQLITNLEKLLSRSSEFLYDTTGGRARFVEIDVILPQTWSKKDNYKLIGGSFYDKSHVRIGISDLLRGDEPYTLQPRGCGEPGEYIRLTDNFVKELESKTKDDFGSPEKHFVHEWAHYRYGVYDEYGIPGDSKYPTFYIEEGKVLPTACVKGIRGSMEDADGKPCKVYRGGIIDSRCKFIPDIKENNARASLMFMPHLNTIDSFCQNDTDDVRLLHNKYAPSKQNILCNYRSTSEVIYSHDDFKNLNETLLTGKYTNPVFQYFRVDEGQSSRFVLVLDTSGSMRDNGRISLLNRAATRFVQDIIPNGMELGIIEFNTNATVLHEMILINDTSRKDLEEIIPKKAEGWTAIGKGFQLALEILRANDGQTRGATIILVSDGQENQKDPTIEEIMPEILEAQIKIDAIAVAVDADTRLENITSITGGRCFYMKDEDDATNTVMETAFMGLVTQQKDVEVQAVSIKTRDIVIVGNRKNYIKSVVIDQELGRNTRFIISSNDIEKLDIKFKAPDGQIYTENNYYYRKDLALKNVQLILPESQVGHWEVIYSKAPQYAHERFIAAALTITSEPKTPETQPIRLNTYFGKMEVRYPATAMIYAEVFKGYNAVIGADVIAIVERPVSGTIEVRLYDDGAGFDVAANDGIYTAAFTQFTSNGRYSVSARVSSSPQTRVRNTRSYYAYSMKTPKKMLNDSLHLSKSEFLITDFEPVSKFPEQIIDSVPAAEFSRESEAGAFKVNNYVPDVDLIPPGRVTNLRVVNFDEDDQIIELQWSAPGDDLFSGNVSKTELKVSRSQESLRDPVMFGNSIEISEEMIMSGSLEPIDGGQIQKVKFEIPEAIFKDGISKKLTKLSIHFAMRGIDDHNNTGEISNIASVHFGYVRPVFDQIIIGTHSRPFETVMTQSHVELPDPVLFYHNRILMQKLRNQTSIRIPKELGRNTKFTITSDDIEHLEIKVMSPNGTIYSKDNNNFKVDYIDMFAEFSISLATPGKWKVRFEKKRKDTLIAYLSVSSESKVDEPIKTRSWMDTPFMSKEIPPSAVINAEITKRYNYIICADVIALVDRPKGAPIMVKLSDNGRGADKVANDGLYSAIFTQFNSNGRYGVTARVLNNDKARLKLGVGDDKVICQ